MSRVPYEDNIGYWLWGVDETGNISPIGEPEDETSTQTVTVTTSPAVAPAPAAAPTPVSRSTTELDLTPQQVKDILAYIQGQKKANEIAARKKANDKWLKIIKDDFHYTGDDAVRNFQKDATSDKVYTGGADNSIGPLTTVAIKYYVDLLERGLSEETTKKWKVMLHIQEAKTNTQ
ncbi:MAG: hypothetical protein PHQ42_02315 [Patescibacteria group bacterium]|nr:hypothetical protein [Patescibacteria group bacterium]